MMFPSYHKKRSPNGIFNEILAGNDLGISTGGAHESLVARQPPLTIENYFLILNWSPDGVP